MTPPEEARVGTPLFPPLMSPSRAKQTSAATRQRLKETRKLLVREQAQSTARNSGGGGGGANGSRKATKPRPWRGVAISDDDDDDGGGGDTDEEDDDEEYEDEEDEEEEEGGGSAGTGRQRRLTADERETRDLIANVDDSHISRVQQKVLERAEQAEYVALKSEMSVR